VHTDAVATGGVMARGLLCKREHEAPQAHLWLWVVAATVNTKAPPNPAQRTLNLGPVLPSAAQVKKRTYAIGRSTLTLEFGDLTKSNADVLVSSDDVYVAMQGGVSSAILRAGGESILIDAAKRVPVQVGDVVVTAAGLLPAKHVFHAITIAYDSEGPKDLVATTTRRCLALLDSLRLSSIAFPAIGAGVAGFPYEDVATQMAEAIVDFLATAERPFDVTVYLLDRFGRMQPEDFVGFFEQVAIQTNGVLATERRSSQAARQSRRARVASDGTPQQLRTNRVLELGRLDGERHSLENRLADRGDHLSRSEKKKIDRQLKKVQQERVEVLAAVRPATASVFVSYARADEKLRKKLGQHLSVLDDEGLTSTWHDRMIGAGSEWEGMIDDRLGRSDVILLLLTSDFIDSRYCKDIEMKVALERHARGEALVVPVLLKPVPLESLPVAKIQALPRNAKPVSEWKNRDSAFVDVTRGLRKAIQNLHSRAADRS
jgi:O-acetyl-ADP-ribose deacetylase (regulator of RNase III)